MIDTGILIYTKYIKQLMEKSMRIGKDKLKIRTREPIKIIKIVQQHKLKDYINYSPLLEQHYTNIESITKEIQDLKTKEKTTSEKMPIWTQIDVLNDNLRKERKSVKWILEWMKEFVEPDKEGIQVPYYHNLTERHRTSDEPLEKGYVWLKSAYPCTRCGHRKYLHGFDDPDRTTNCTGRGTDGGCTCPIFTSNKKYPFAKPETCPHTDIDAYGKDMKKLKVFCTNIYCSKELTNTKQGKELIEHYQRKAPTEKEWKELRRFHSDTFIDRDDELMLIEIELKDDSYVIKEGEKLCKECYSNKHTNQQHFKQSFQEMIKSYEESIKRFDGNMTLTTKEKNNA